MAKTQLGKITADQERIKFFFGEHEFTMRRRFKRLKFLRLINSDPIAALELALGEEEYARLEDLDLSDEDFAELMETIAQRMAGASAGNSRPSPRS